MTQPNLNRFLNELYQKLLHQYGPQGWWPLLSLDSTVNPTERGRNTGYHPADYHLPNSDSGVFEVMLGAILTQNTAWTNADKTLGNLAEKKLLSINKLNSLSHEELGQVIRSSGYYNQKSTRIHRLCEFLSKNPISKLQKLSIADLRDILLNIKGIGPETADSIILYAFKKPSFVIDAYTRRLLQRMGIVQTKHKYSYYRDLFQEIFSPNAENYPLYNEYHALIVQHCVHYCTKVPKCTECFLNAICPQKIESSTPNKKKT